MMRKVISHSFSKTKIPLPIVDCYYFKWNKGKETEIHDHAKNCCLMLVIRGRLREKLFNKNIEVINTSIYKPLSISLINNKKGYHSILPEDESLSIHFYYPKNHITNYYKNL